MRLCDGIKRLGAELSRAVLRIPAAPCNDDYRPFRQAQEEGADGRPEGEVYFPQEHPPGREAQIDFIHCGELKVTVAGQPYQHLLFQLIPSHSGWRYAEVAAGETFLALQKGLQNGLWTLGGIPQVVHSDNPSATPPTR